VIVAVIVSVWVFEKSGKEISVERITPFCGISREDCRNLNIFGVGLFAYQTVAQYMADGGFTVGVSLFAAATAVLVFSLRTFTGEKSKYSKLLTWAPILSVFYLVMRTTRFTVFDLFLSGMFFGALRGAYGSFNRDTEGVVDFKESMKLGELKIKNTGNVKVFYQKHKSFPWGMFVGGIISARLTIDKYISTHTAGVMWYGAITVIFVLSGTLFRAFISQFDDYYKKQEIRMKHAGIKIPDLAGDTSKINIKTKLDSLLDEFFVLTPDRENLPTVAI